MAEFPALPLFTDAYLADTLDLTTQEHGIYLVMLMIAWRRRDCSLPDDMAWLKRSLQSCCAGLHGRTFNAVVPKLLNRFWVRKESETGPKWCQNRLEKELKYLRNRSETNSKAAQQRWKNNHLHNANGIPGRNPPTPTLHNGSDISNTESVSRAVKNVSKQLRVNGNGYATNDSRIQYAIQKAIGFLPGRDPEERWQIAQAAEDIKHPRHAEAVSMMLAATKQAKVGWISPERRKHE